MVIGVAEQLGKSFDAGVPQTFVAKQPLIGVGQWARIDSHVVNATAYGAFHESGALQRTDMLGCGREGHVVRGRELTDGLLAFGESPKHGAPRVVAQRPKYEVEWDMRVFNHMVEHRRL